MTEHWKKTQALFSSLITDPPLLEKYLIKPAPRYIFAIVINTMKKTGFPKGLFTEEEETENHFKADRENKVKFLKKVIDITKLVTKENISIDITNILKGLEVEQTHLFLHRFYQAATRPDINKNEIIKKYLDNMKQNKEVKQNDKNKSLEKPIKQEKKEKTGIEKINQKIINDPKNEIKGYIIWIDQNVYNSENTEYIKNLKENKLYEDLLSHLQFLCFDDLDEAFVLILSYIKYIPLFIIISGKLYSTYYNKLNKAKKYIQCLPICIIFTSEKFKKILTEEGNHFKLTDESYYTINDSFYNIGGICSNFKSCIDFIFNFYYTYIEKNYPLKKGEKGSYDGCLTFENIYDKNQLIFPFLYNELFFEENVSDNDINHFKNFMITNFREKPLIDLIYQILYIKQIPHEIIAKYFLRAYTEQTSFCYEMNRLLMKQSGKDFQIFINILFEGLSNESLSISEDEYLYRGTKMNKKEIDQIINLFNQWKNKSNKSLPSFLLYSRCFLSFTKDKNAILQFIKGKENNKYQIMFQLKNNKAIINKYSSNADIEFLSKYGNENEVLFSLIPLSV